MYGLAGSQERRRVSCAKGAAQPTPKGAGMPEKGSWVVAVCAAIAVLLGLPTLTVLSTHVANQENHPSDEELAANFFSHEARFDELVQMLTTDYPRLAAKGDAGIDLTTVASLATNAARSGVYRGLLQQISVEDLRYFPDSGKLVLVPDGQENSERPSKYYLYIPHAQPRSLTPSDGYASRGPGVYVLKGERPLKGSWFIRHDMTIEVAVAPY